MPTIPTSAGTEREPMLGIEALSEWLDVPVWTLRAWRHRGEGPPAVKLGGHLRWRRRDVEQWIADQEKS